MLLILIVGISSLMEILGASPSVDSQPRPQILHHEIDTADIPNSYKFQYNASDGSSRTEQGAMLDPNTGETALNVLGTVRWYDDKGQLYEMTYKAGRRGYRTIIRKIA